MQRNKAAIFHNDYVSVSYILYANFHKGKISEVDVSVMYELRIHSEASNITS